LIQTIAEGIFFAITMLLIFFFVPNEVTVNMFQWPIESKILFTLLSFIGFIVNILVVYEDTDSISEINCKCPYCEKEFKI